MNSKNMHSKRVIANNIFTGIVVLLIITAIALVVTINIKDKGKGNYSKETWNAVSDSDMFGKNGNLISVYPMSNEDTTELKVTGIIKLKGFFISPSGKMAAILQLPSSTVSMEKGESVGGITLVNIEDGLVTLEIDGENAFLTLDEPSYEIKQ